MKKVVGIISIVLFIFILFQSCVAGIGNSLEGTGSTSGTTGLMLSFILLIAGILSLVSREKKIVTIFAAVFYLFGALLGFAEPNPYGDLVIWTWMCLIFGTIIIFSLVRKNKTKVKEKENKKEVN